MLIYQIDLHAVSARFGGRGKLDVEGNGLSRRHSPRQHRLAVGLRNDGPTVVHNLDTGHNYSGPHGLATEPEGVTRVSDCYGNLQLCAWLNLTGQRITQRESSTQCSRFTAVRHAGRSRVFGNLYAGKVMVVSGDRAQR